MRGKEAVPRNLLVGGWGWGGRGTVLLGWRVVFHLQVPGQDLPGVWWSLLHGSQGSGPLPPLLPPADRTRKTKQHTTSTIFYFQPFGGKDHDFNISFLCVKLLFVDAGNEHLILEQINELGDIISWSVFHSSVASLMSWF